MIVLHTTGGEKVLFMETVYPIHYKVHPDFKFKMCEIV